MVVFRVAYLGQIVLAFVTVCTSCTVQTVFFNFYFLIAKGSDKKSDDKLGKATTDACKITTEVLNGMLGQIIKDRLFNQSANCRQGPQPPTPQPAT